MQAVTKMCLNKEYIEPNHFNLIMNGLKTGFNAMQEVRESLIRPDDSDTIYRNLIVDVPDGKRIIFNEIQKIHLSEIIADDSKVFNDGYLKLDRFITGIPIRDYQLKEEVKKGHLIGYCKELKTYYKLECEEF